MTARRPPVLVVTCEHGGADVPARYARRFRGAARLLRSHRGFDLGALVLAHDLARAFRAPLIASTTTRLVVDLNRSERNRAVFSEFTRDLPEPEREALLERYHRPHRDAVRHAVAAAVRAGQRVVHVAAHSFTPVLNGKVRPFEVAFLYDPRRAAERALCARWRDALHAADPTLRIARNRPYKGTSDGLTTWLRTLHPDSRYAGIELEVNQAVIQPRSRTWPDLRRRLITSLGQALGVDRPPGGSPPGPLLDGQVAWSGFHVRRG